MKFLSKDERNHFRPRSRLKSLRFTGTVKPVSSPKPPSTAGSEAVSSPPVPPEERLAWLRGCLFGLHHALGRHPSLRRWRRRVPHALESEALLLAFRGAEALLGAELGRALGLPPDQARSVAGRAERLGLVRVHGEGLRLTRAGRRLAGELERAYAEAIRQVSAALGDELEAVPPCRLARWWLRLEAMSESLEAGSAKRLDSTANSRSPQGFGLTPGA